MGAVDRELKRMPVRGERKKLLFHIPRFGYAEMTPIQLAAAFEQYADHGWDDLVTEVEAQCQIVTHREWSWTEMLLILADARPLVIK